MVKRSGKLKTIFIFFLLISPELRASEIDPVTFTARFERTTFEGKIVEIARGTLFYQKGGKVTLEVTFPLNQIMVIDDKLMLIYYPDENKGFRIESTIPFSLPFLNAVLAPFKPLWGLSKLGLKLLRYEKEGGKLYTYWGSPKRSDRLLVLVMDGEKLIYTETQLADGRPILRTWYHRHIKYKGRFIPVDLSTEKVINGKSIREHIVFREMKFDSPIPQHILNFRIPATAEVKEVKW